MEAKLDDNAKKIQNLQEVVNVLKEESFKKVEPKLGEQNQSSNKDAKMVLDTPSEMDKLKADILVLKNKDIETLKVNLEEIKETVKVLQESLKTRSK
jgi:hypothetical protein